MTVTLHCRSCPTTKPVRGPSYARAYPSAIEDEPGVWSYVCRPCRTKASAVTLWCRSCGKSKTFNRHDGPIPKSREDDSYLCKDCTGRKHLEEGRGALLKRYGSTNTPYRVLTAQRAHIEAVLEKLGRSNIPEKRLTRSTYIAEGLHEIRSRANAARAAHGLSDKGREKLAIAQIIKKKRPGTWVLCVCQKVLYLSPSDVERGSKGLHGACYHAWQHSPEWAEWHSKMRNAREDPLTRARLRPAPLPEVKRRPGKAATSAGIENGFRWTLRHYYQHESWREIAQSEGFAHITVKNAVDSFIAKLPDTWAIAFGGGATARHLDEYVPIDALRRVAGN